MSNSGDVPQIAVHPVELQAGRDRYGYLKVMCL